MPTNIIDLFKKHGPILSFDAGWVTIIGGKRLMNCQRCGNTFGMSELSPQGYCRACAPLAAQELAGTQQPYRLTLANVRSSIEQLQKDHDALCKTVFAVGEEVKTAHERIGDLRKDFLAHTDEHRAAPVEPDICQQIEGLLSITAPSRWSMKDIREALAAANCEIMRLRNDLQAVRPVEIKHHSPHRVDQ